MEMKQKGILVSP